MAQYKKETILGQIKPVKTLEIWMELDLGDLGKVPGKHQCPDTAPAHHPCALFPVSECIL